MPQSAMDTMYRVETPEGIDLEVQLAGPVPRVLAYSIDLLIRSVLIGIFSAVLLFLGKMGAGLFLVVSFLMEWFYPVFYEVYREGQTPGKRRMRLAAVNDDLTPITWDASMTRNLLRAADFLPFGYLLGLISICVGKNFQRLGDLAAGTIVIHQPAVQRINKLPEVSPVMPPVNLTMEDQIAIVGFTQRHQQLTKARQEELAEILQPVTHREPKAAVSYLQGIGAWLLGAR